MYNQAELTQELESIFSGGMPLSLEEIGVKLSEKGILSKTELGVFSQYLTRRLSDTERENQLMSLCCGKKSEDIPFSQVQELLKSNLNWSYLLNEAGRQRLAPLLYHNLRKLDNDSLVPPEVIRSLEIAYQANAVRNAALYAELEQILNAFNQTGIKVVLLKGAALGVAVYQDIALRPMSDLDLLIRKDDLPCAVRVLEQLDYSYAKPQNVPPEWFYRYFCEIPYTKEGESPVEIDLHWNLVEFPGLFPLEMSRIWQRTQPIAIGNETALILSTEDMLLHLCYHASFKHLFESNIRAGCDIAATIRVNHSKIDWDAFLNYTLEAELEHCVYALLYITQKTVGAEIPSAFLEGLKSNCQKGVIPWLEGSTQKKYKIETLGRVLFLKKTICRLRYLSRILFPPADYLALINSSSPTNRNVSYLRNLLALQKARLLKLYRLFLSAVFKKPALSPGAGNLKVTGFQRTRT